MQESCMWTNSCIHLINHCSYKYFLSQHILEITITVPTPLELLQVLKNATRINIKVRTFDSYYMFLKHVLGYTFWLIITIKCKNYSYWFAVVLWLHNTDSCHEIVCYLTWLYQSVLRMSFGCPTVLQCKHFT